MAAMTLRAAFVLAFVLVLGSPAHAHQLDNSYAEFRVATNVVHAKFTFLPQCFQPFSQGPAAIVSLQDPIDVNLEKIQEHLKQNVAVTADGAAAAIENEERRINEDLDVLEILFTYRWDKPISQLHITYNPFTDIDPTHICFAVVRAGEKESQYVLQEGSRELTVTVRAAEKNVWSQVREFTALGMHHIFTGYDHIAFIIGLLLITRTFGGLVKVVTAFTLAHSITLAAATLNLVNAPAWFVEPAIAATIAAVGVENLFHVRGVMFYAPIEWRRPRGKRWLVAFAFGLIHGFGFANVLKEMHLSTQGLAVSLVCFNFGVEIGQIAIVSAIFPFLVGLERLSQRAHRVLIWLGSLIIVGLAAMWFAQRVGWL